jgi:hypothetical protein
VDVPGILLPGTPREAGLIRMIVDHMKPVIATFDVVAGRSISAWPETSECGSRDGRGHGEEPLWTVVATSLPPSIALNGEPHCTRGDNIGVNLLD